MPSKYRHVLTILVDLFFLSDKSAHPLRVVVVEYQTLVIWVPIQVLLQHMTALLVLPQLEQVLSQHQRSVKLPISLSHIHLVRPPLLSVTMNKTVYKETLLDVSRSSHP